MLKNKDIEKESDVTSTTDIVKNDMVENAIMRMNRRTFVKMAGAAAGTLALGGGLSQLIPKAQAVPPASAPSLIKYVDPLPIPPVAVPVGPNSYAIPMVKATTHKFHRDLPAAPTYSYGTTAANLLTLPTTPPAPVTPIKSPTTWKEIVLQEVMDPVTGEPMEVLLDGVHFVDTLGNTPLITETNGATSVWQFVNTTADAHPMHPHLVPFKVLDRQKFNKVKFLTAWNAWLLSGRVGPRPSVDAYLQGSPILPPPEETGLKDTAKSYPGEVLRIVATFNKAIAQGTVPARYVCHCHILEHEENDMMFQFEVV